MSSLAACFLVNQFELFDRIILETWAIFDRKSNLSPSICHRVEPTIRSTLGLIVPFQQMQQKTSELASNRSTFTLAQRFDLFNQRLNIDFLPSVFPQQLSGSLKPL